MATIGGDLGFEAGLFKAADKLRGSMEPRDYKHVAGVSAVSTQGTVWPNGVAEGL